MSRDHIPQLSSNARSSEQTASSSFLCSLKTVFRLAWASAQAGLRKCAINAVNGQLVIARLFAKYAQQMPTIGVCRISLQDLPTDLLGSLEPAGSMVLYGNRERFRNGCHSIIVAARPVGRNAIMLAAENRFGINSTSMRKYHRRAVKLGTGDRAPRLGRSCGE